MVAFAVLPAFASSLIVDGRPIDIDVHPPFLPASESECNVFQAQAMVTTKILEEAHDECLKNNRSGGAGIDVEVRLPDGRRATRCTTPLCQSLHSTRDEYRDKLKAAYSQCMAEAQERSHNSLVGGQYSSVGDEEAYVSRRLAMGPIQGLVKYVKAEFTAAVEHYFGSKSRFLNKGIEVSDAVGFFSRATQDLHAKCAESKDATILRECHEALIDSISSFTRKVPVKFRYEPGIDLIQRAMMEKLQHVMRNIDSHMENVQSAIDEMSISEPVQPDGLARKGRRTPLIENK
jgi:hypothetical protein